MSFTKLQYVGSSCAMCTEIYIFASVSHGVLYYHGRSSGILPTLIDFLDVAILRCLLLHHTTLSQALKYCNILLHTAKFPMSMLLIFKVSNAYVIILYLFVCLWTVFVSSLSQYETVRSWHNLLLLLMSDSMLWCSKVEYLSHSQRLTKEPSILGILSTYINMGNGIRLTERSLWYTKFQHENTPHRCHMVLLVHWLIHFINIVTY